MEEMPPGFRFFPTEEELISFYLHNKLQQRETSYIDRVIPLLHVYSFEPWQLPKQCGELCHGDPEQWFFFVPRQEREVRGGKPSRTTESGYWKATGSPSYVHSCNGKVIGVKKSMVFYQGKAPTGRKTKWKMNEYRAIKEDKLTSVPELQHEVTLCRVYVVSGSLRAFDRRPTAVEMSISTSNYITMIHTQENDSKVAGIIPNTNQNATLKALKEESCSSESNSFSEGNQSIEYAPVENEEASVFNFLENLIEWENTITL